MNLKAIPKPRLINSWKRFETTKISFFNVDAGVEMRSQTRLTFARMLKIVVRRKQIPFVTFFQISSCTFFLLLEN